MHRDLGSDDPALSLRQRISRLERAVPPLSDDEVALWTALFAGLDHIADPEASARAFIEACHQRGELATLVMMPRLACEAEL